MKDTIKFYFDLAIIFIIWFIAAILIIVLYFPSAIFIKLKKRIKTMKTFQTFFVALLTVILFVSCSNNTPGQPRSNYDIEGSVVPGTIKYHFFAEKKSTAPYKLQQGMDYVMLGSDTTTLRVGTASIPTFTINLLNDGSEYKIGIVAENLSGYYGGMGTAIDTVGIVPGTPVVSGLRKR